jgi:sulfur carrier protein ThiS
VAIEFRRNGRSEVHEVSVDPTSPVRVVLRQLGYPPEGSAVLDGEQPLPLDEPVGTRTRLIVLPAFSGG